MIKIITKENLVLFFLLKHKDPVFVSHLARTSRASPPDYPQRLSALFRTLLCQVLHCGGCHKSGQSHSGFCPFGSVSFPCSFPNPLLSTGSDSRTLRERTLEGTPGSDSVG